eukprot:g30872.t1
MILEMLMVAKMLTGGLLRERIRQELGIDIGANLASAEELQDWMDWIIEDRLFCCFVAVISVLDVDGDGTISQAEFCDLGEDLRGQVGHFKDLAQAFSQQILDSTDQNSAAADAIVFANASSKHSAAVYQAALTNARLARLRTNKTVAVKVHLFPQTKDEQVTLERFAGFMLSVYITFCLSFIPAGITHYLVKERSSGARQLQALSGASHLAYWLANLIYEAWRTSLPFDQDLALYVLPAISVPLALQSFGYHTLLKGDCGKALICVLAAFGPAIAGFSYIVSFLFKDHSRASNTILSFCLVGAIVLSTVLFVLAIINYDPTAQYPSACDYPTEAHPEGNCRSPGARTADRILGPLFRMVPTVCVYQALFAIAMVANLQANGKQIWHYETPGVSNNEPLLVDDLVLGSTQQGNAFAVERLTGHVRWIAALADDAGGDAGYPNAHEGIFVVSAHKSWKAPTDGGNERIFGLHVSNGSRIWQYTPEVPVWNFAPLFPADGSVVFMDWTGGVYRLNLTTGEEIWKVLAESNKSFGDGGVALSETMVYSCSNFGHFTGDEGTPGVVRAFYLSNGTEVWSKFLEMPCNSYPAVGHLAGFDQLALVVTPGSFMDLFHHVGRALRGEVLALDALTGAQLWRYPVAPYDGGPIGMAVGDFEGFPARVLEGIQLVCYPAHWSAPLIDGSGQVLVGRADGNLHWILGPEGVAFFLVAILMDFAIHSPRLARQLDASTWAQRVSRWVRGRSRADEARLMSVYDDAAAATLLSTRGCIESAFIEFNGAKGRHSASRCRQRPVGGIEKLGDTSKDAAEWSKTVFDLTQLDIGLTECAHESLFKKHFDRIMQFEEVKLFLSYPEPKEKEEKEKIDQHLAAYRISFKYARALHKGAVPLPVLMDEVLIGGIVRTEWIILKCMVYAVGIFLITTAALIPAMTRDGSDSSENRSPQNFGGYIVAACFIVFVFLNGFLMAVWYPTQLRNLFSQMTSGFRMFNVMLMGKKAATAECLPHVRVGDRKQMFSWYLLYSFFISSIQRRKLALEPTNRVDAMAAMESGHKPTLTHVRKRRFSQAQRSFLLECLGDEDFLSAESGEEFCSIPGSPVSGDINEAWAKRTRDARVFHHPSSRQDESGHKDPGPSLESIYGFDAEEMARLGRHNVLNFVFIDDDEEEDGCTDGIEEVFSFDMDKVAEALRRGANQEELSAVIEEAMVKDLPQRIAAARSGSRGEREAVPTSPTLTPRTGDLSALMTPPRSDVLEGLKRVPIGQLRCASPHRGVSSTDLAARLQKIRGQNGSTRRRSSIAQHPQLIEAVNVAKAQHRKSLAKVVETELRQAAASPGLSTQPSLSSAPQEGTNPACYVGKTLNALEEIRPALAAQVRRSLARAQRRRRASLIRAAEVLEAAGVGVGRQHAPNEVLEHLDVVQRAVETAARRHREMGCPDGRRSTARQTRQDLRGSSIIVAIAHVSNADEEEPEPMPEAEEKEKGTEPRAESYWQECVSEIVAVAYEAFTSCLLRK